MVTIEDVMEEIFGEIRDEHDTEEIMDRKINDNEYLSLAALKLIRSIKNTICRFRKMRHTKHSEDYIIYHHENIPQPKEEVIIPPFTFTILQVKDNRIEQVRLKVNKEE